jgi:hypothetical protein
MTRIKKVGSHRILVQSGQIRATPSNANPRPSGPVDHRAARIIQRRWRSHFFIRYCKTAAKRSRMMRLKTASSHRMLVDSGQAVV